MGFVPNHKKEGPAVRALCRRLMQPRLQLGLSVVITVFTAYAWWRSHWGGPQAAILAAVTAVTAYEWRVLPRRAPDEREP